MEYPFMDDVPIESSIVFHRKLHWSGGRSTHLTSRTGRGKSIAMCAMRAHDMVELWRFCHDLPTKLGDFAANVGKYAILLGDSTWFNMANWKMNHLQMILPAINLHENNGFSIAMWNDQMVHGENHRNVGSHAMLPNLLGLVHLGFVWWLNGKKHLSYIVDCPAKLLWCPDSLWEVKPAKAVVL